MLDSLRVSTCNKFMYQSIITSQLILSSPKEKQPPGNVMEN